MHELAAMIRDNLDTLTEEYDRRLQEIEGYAAMPGRVKRAALSRLAASLENADDAEFIQFVQAAMEKMVALGLATDPLLQGLVVLEEMIVPLVSTVGDATFLWRAFSRARAIVSLRTAEMLRESELKFRTLADNIAVGIFIHRDGLLRYVGREGARILGYDNPDELVGRSILDFVHPEERERIADIARRRVAGEPVPEQYETRLFSKDGSPVDVWLYSALIEYEGQTATQGAFIDITERKRVEEALRESQARYMDLYENANDMLFTVDLEGRFTSANRAAYTALGYTREDVYEKNIFDVLTPASANFAFESLQKAIVQGSDLSELQPWEFEVVRRDGSKRLFEVRTRLIREEDEIAGFQGIARDITERKRAEQALEEQQAFLRQVIDINPNFVFVRDREGRFILANRAIAEVYNTTVDDLIGKTDADFNLNPEEVERIRRGDIEVMDSLQEMFIPETCITDVEGNVHWFQTIKRPLVDEDGVARRVLGVSSDVTERKRLEQAMQESLERRGRQVQTSTEVAQEIAAATKLDELFRRVVTLVKERFGYYHAQIFRYDPELNAMRVVEGYGEIGEKMKAAGHNLPYGRGVVGTAAATGEPVLATNVSQDPYWVPNPNLPDTKGELAVPIKLRRMESGEWRDEVLGILDVQSDTAGALSEEDQVMLLGLAGQIASAIESTRLFEQTQAALEEVETTHRLYLREQWAKFVPARVAPLYERARPDVAPLDDAGLPAVEQAMRQREVVVQSGGDGGDEQAAVVAPITLRGEVIGALGLHEAAGGRQWTDDEVALIEDVAEQLALAIENVRLLEETQRRAQRDRLIADITAKVRSSADVETIMRTAVRELGAALDTDRAFVRLSTGTPAQEAGSRK